VDWQFWQPDRAVPVIAAINNAFQFRIMCFLPSHPLTRVKPPILKEKREKPGKKSAFGKKWRGRNGQNGQIGSNSVLWDWKTPISKMKW